MPGWTVKVSLLANEQATHSVATYGKAPGRPNTVLKQDRQRRQLINVLNHHLIDPLLQTRRQPGLPTDPNLALTHPPIEKIEESDRDTRDRDPARFVEDLLADAQEVETLASLDRYVCFLVLFVCRGPEDVDWYGDYYASLRMYMRIRPPDTDFS